jgi:Leucine-rich repeat (LRR) protein
MNRHLRNCTICLSLALVAACGSYDFTVNDKVVYTPDPLFSDFDVPDKALRECIREAINDAKASNASEVSSLSCTDAGVESLAGLSTFTELEQLTLSSNNISNIGELAALTVLQVVYLDNNRIIDPVPLYQLPALHRLDLSSNPGLICPAPGSLLRVSYVTLPEHCR